MKQAETTDLARIDLGVASQVTQASGQHVLEAEQSLVNLLGIGAD